MTTITTRIRNLAFALGITGALGFGVTTASAAAPDGMAKRDCLFYTSSAAICAQKCFTAGYSDWAWNPSNFCCECE